MLILKTNFLNGTITTKFV